MIGLDQINQLTNGKLGIFDCACPACGPERRSRANQRKPVLRIWHHEPGFATYSCARCGLKGHTRDPNVVKIDRAHLERIKAEAAAREREAHRQRLSIARYLWSIRKPLERSSGERYLRARGYGGPIPATLGYLPPRAQHGPAMIAAFGQPVEPEPSILSIADEAVRGVHLTRLSGDCLNKAGVDPDKIMIGHSAGSPIVLAPMNDLLSLAIVEGIEKGLAIFEATRLGVWVAGAASRLPALSNAVPDWTDCITVFGDDDAEGKHHATMLGAALRKRGLYVEPKIFRG